MLWDSDNFLQVRNPLDLQTHFKLDSFWKVHFHYCSFAVRCKPCKYTLNSYFLILNTKSDQNLSPDSVFNADIDTAPTTLVECQQAQISLLVTVAAAYPATAPVSVQNECTFSSAGE